MKLLLYEILNERNISVNQLHKLTGISRTTLDPLSKTRKLPSKTRFETIERIAETLDIPIYKIIEFDDEISNSSRFSVEILKPLNEESNSFDAYLKEYIDRIKLKVNAGNSYYLLTLTARYSPGKLFENKFKKEYERLNYLFDSLRDSLDDEETLVDREFNELYNFLKNESQKYKDDCVFSAENSFSVVDISHSKKERSNLIDNHKLIKNSFPLTKIIGNDDFINTLSNYIIDLYQLRSQKIQRVLEPWELSKNFISDDGYQTIDTDYININYFSQSKDIEKYIKHKIYF